jgi:hypothetical protein
MLELVDDRGKRVNVTNLDVYDVGDPELGDETREIIYPMGSLPDSRGTVDLYALNPGRVVEMCQDSQVLNTVSFTYIKSGDAVPCIE